MSMLKTYETAMESEFSIMMQEFDIACERAINDYTYETAIMAASGSIVMEEELPAKEDGAFMKFIKSIVDAIINILTAFRNMISNAFTMKDDVTPKDYLNSQTGKVQLDYDLAAIQKGAEDEVRKGRKLIQLISKTTGIDDAEVENFCDGCTDFVLKHKKALVVSGGAFAVYKMCYHGSEKTQAEVKKAAEDVKNAEGLTNKGKAQCRKIFVSLKGLINDTTKVTGTVLTNLEKENKKA